MGKNRLAIIIFIASLLLGVVSILIVNPSKGEVPRKALVAPGKHDDYYGFLSGGPGGDIRVIGVPSMRVLRRIPVFEPSKRYDYGVDEKGAPVESFGSAWGDTHHPTASQTDGEYDGRWLFINDKGNGRVGKINLKTFKVESVLKVPTARAVHGLAVDPNETKFLAGAIEYPIDLEKELSDDPDKKMGGIVVIDPKTMKVKYQIVAPRKDKDFG